MSPEIDIQSQVERLVKLLYRISKHNAWMSITDIVASVWVKTYEDDHAEMLLLNSDEEVEKRLIEKYGISISK